MKLENALKWVAKIYATSAYGFGLLFLPMITLYGPTSSGVSIPFVAILWAYFVSFIIGAIVLWLTNTSLTKNSMLRDPDE